MSKEINKEFTLLIVEDNQTSLDFLKLVFKRMGFNVLTSIDGEGGLELYKNNHVDIVITDISLPGFSGIELSRRIKNIDNDVIIIVVTAYSDSRLLLQAIELRINNYVLKPVDKDVITQIVNKHIESILLERNYRNQQNLVLKLSLAVQKSSSKIVLLDSDNNISFLNDSFESFTGFSFSNGITIFELFDFHDKNTEYLKNAIDNKIEWRGEVKTLKSGGEFFWAFITLTPLFDGELFIGFVLILQDITHNKQRVELLKHDKMELEKLVFQRTSELQMTNNRLLSEIEGRKIIENELVIAKKKAEALNSAKTMFLAKVSHELRTPMNGIIGMTNLLFETEITDKQKKYLESVKFSANSLLEIINDLLDYSKIEFGKFELINQTFSLKQDVFKLLEPHKSAASSKGLDFNIIIDNNIPDNLIGDSSRLSQIIINLVSNAIKFTSKGGVEVKFNSLGIMDDKVKLECLVKDTGIGIAEENFAKIFEGFTQIEPTLTRKYGGTGLGLSISKEIVDMMGGKIEFTSKPGLGSTFKFVIELKIDSQTKEIKNLISNTELSKLLSLNNINVLVIEDSDINREVLYRILSNLGCNVKLFSNGFHAVQDFQINDYDIVFIDIIMPVIDGIETLKLIKEVQKPIQTPFIALTALGDDDPRSECINVGFDAWMSKPVNKEKLTDVILKHTVLKHPPASLDLLKSQLNNNTQSLNKIVNYFINNSPNEIEIVENYHKKKDFENLSKIVHKMKSELSHLDSRKAVHLAREIEKKIQSDDLEKIDDLINYFIQSVNEVSSYLNDYIKRIYGDLK